MELFFSREEMTKALCKLGYTVELVQAWYKPLTSMNEDDSEDDLKSINIYVAYKEKPEELKKEKPMLLNLYKLEDVFATVMKSMILEKLF